MCSRTAIAPLQPPYAPDIASAVRPHHARCAAAGAVSRHGRQRHAWEKFRAGSLLRSRAAELREREIVIDRTCARTGASTNGVHVTTFADAAHLTEQQVSATVFGVRTVRDAGRPRSRR